MHDHFSGRRRRKYSREHRMWSWAIFLVGLFVFGWGCTTQTQQRRDPRGDRRDQIGLDQYDRFLGDRRDARPQRRQRRYASRWGSRQDSWLDGDEPRRSARGQMRPYRAPARRAPRNPTAQDTPTGRCLQLPHLSAQKRCLLPLLTQGTKVSRKQHLKSLLGGGLPGIKVVFSMLQRGEVGLRTFLMRSILHDTAFVSTQSKNLMSALYKIAKQDFLEALSTLPNDKKMRVASRLLMAMRFFTRKRAASVFKPYLQLPANMLWSRIQRETALSASMALVGLSDCTKGKHQTPVPYAAAMRRLQHYYVTWQVWNYAANASGMRQYLRAMRAFRSGRSRYRPRPRINRKALKVAIVLARKLEQLKPNTEKAILAVRSTIPRQRMKNWFSKLVSQSPKLGRRRGALPGRRTKPNPRGKIEL